MRFWKLVFCLQYDCIIDYLFVSQLLDTGTSTSGSGVDGYLMSPILHIAHVQVQMR